MITKGRIFLGSIVSLLLVKSALAVDSATIIVPQPAGFKITDLGRVISAAFALILFIAGLLAFVFLLLGGIQWITSGGDKAGLESARNKIIHAIVGLIVVFSAWAIVILIQNFLGYTILGPFNIPRPFD